VCDDETLPSQDIWELLTHLVDKSLVNVEKSKEETRYKMLETVKQYSLAKLKNVGEMERVQERHLDFFLKLAEQAEPELVGPKQKEWLDKLEREHDNLRGAIEWVLEGEDRDKGLRLTGALWRFWEVRGHYQEGLQSLESTLAYESMRTLARAKALTGAGNLAFNQGDHIRSRSFHEEGLVIRREMEDKRGIAISLNNLGNVALVQGEYLTARSLYQESLSIRRELKDKRAIASLFNNLGIVAMVQGDYMVALSFHQESLAIKHELGDKLGIANSLNALGEAAHAQKDYERACSLHQESLALGREIGEKGIMASALHGLGNIAYSQEDYAIAHSFYQDSLTIERDLGARRRIIDCLARLVMLASITGRFYCAARLSGALRCLTDAIGATTISAAQADYDRHIASLRASLGDEAFEKYWAEGRAMSMEQAIEYALSTELEEAAENGTPAAPTQ